MLEDSSVLMGVTSSLIVSWGDVSSPSELESYAADKVSMLIQRLKSTTHAIDCAYAHARAHVINVPARAC